MNTPTHIVLLVADSLRYDAVYQGADHRLPYATARGVTFHQARSAGCWTLPATAALFTGAMPHEHGGTSQSRGIHKDIPTLAERIQVLGYTPSMVSANVVTTDIFGLHRGFDQIECAWQHMSLQSKWLQSLLVLAGKPRLRRKICSIDFVAGKLKDDFDAAKVWLQSTIDVVFDRARQILHAAQRQKRRSFCFLNIMETHFPYHIGEVFETSALTLWDKVREIYSLFHLVNQTWLIRNKQYIAPDMLVLLRRRQRQAWEYIAARVDAFIQEVRECYNALVVFASDHGDNFGEQGWQYHFSNVNDAGTRVPLIWIPHDADATRDVYMPVSTRDLFGALLQAAGDQDPTLFSLIDEPSRSTPIMQSYWYNNRGRTRPCYRYNQFAFIAGTQRYVHRGSQWYTAPITRHDEPEPNFEPLALGVNPLHEGIDYPERIAYVQRSFDAYRVFADCL